MTRPRVATIAGALGIGAGVCGYLSIPAVAADPDAASPEAAIAIAVGATISAAVGALVIAAGSRRGALVALGLIGIAVGLVILDGAVAFTEHPRAPLAAPVLFWAAFAGDAAGGLGAIVAGLLPGARRTLA